MEFRFVFVQFLQKKRLQDLFRISRRPHGIDGYPAEGTANGAALPIFRSDLLKRDHGNPVEDGILFRIADNRLPAVMATHDHEQKEAEGDRPA
ncbi:MAG: hypothetical protein ACD_87C00017G0006 [uncultured bacterium]|nr:MAG: hypothetical protein ACD_87C00017G0006 [uncultured bacterium]